MTRGPVDLERDDVTSIAVERFALTVQLVRERISPRLPIGLPRVSNRIGMYVWRVPVLEPSFGDTM